MKTERRHQLQHNELADSIGSFIQRLAPYGNWIVGGIILLVGAVFGGQYYMSQQAAKNEQAWNAYFGAASKRDLKDGPVKLSPARLNGIVKAHPGTVASLWAEQKLGDTRLQNGISLMFTDPSEGRSELNKAQSNFEAVLAGAKSLDREKAKPLLQKATFGLAQTYETLASTGDVKEALKHYGEIVSRWPGDGYALRAKERVAALKRQQELGDNSFYAEFETWTRERVEARANAGDSSSSSPFEGHPPLDQLLNGTVPPDPTPPGKQGTEPGKTNAEKQPEGESKPEGEKKPDAAKKTDGDKPKDGDAANEKQDPPAKKPAADQEGDSKNPPKSD